MMNTLYATMLNTLYSFQEKSQKRSRHRRVCEQKSVNTNLL